ncbi:YdcF family protein [Clostridium akagii]|uniref:YdcF family protein n=1 Tax=Clostridium akagii TaxID=91623 RepID=UPI00068D3ACF|nr:YdcF family protein [Clostridium akagii]
MEKKTPSETKNSVYKEGYGKYIIVSGGKGPGEDITEAMAMKNFLLAKGIDKNKIIMEERSRNTMENLTFSKKVMESKGFKTAVVVSNKYHLKRVSLMSKRLRMNTSYSGVFVSQYKFTEYEGYVREVFGVLKFVILKK